MIRGWQATGILNTQDPNSGFSFQAQLPDGQVCTIQFKVEELQPLSVSVPPVDNRTSFPVAEVSWFVEGSYVTRIIALSNGTSISGTGRNVKVRVYDAYNPNVLQNKYQYRVSAQVSKGLRSTTVPPVYAIIPVTYYDTTGTAQPIPKTWSAIPGFFIAQATEKYFFPIPLIAGVSTYRVTAIAVGNVVLGSPGVPTLGIGKILIQEGAFFSPTGIGVLGSNNTKELYYSSLSVDTGWLPVSPGSQGVLLTNSYTAPLVDPAIAVNITFGIDG